MCGKTVVLFLRWARGRSPVSPPAENISRLLIVLIFLITDLGAIYLTRRDPYGTLRWGCFFALVLAIAVPFVNLRGLRKAIEERRPSSKATAATINANSLGHGQVDDG